MLHQTFLFLGQLWQLFEVSQIIEFLRYAAFFFGNPSHLLDHQSGLRVKITGS